MASIVPNGFGLKGVKRTNRMSFGDPPGRRLAPTDPDCPVEDLAPLARGGVNDSQARC